MLDVQFVARMKRSGSMSSFRDLHAEPLCLGPADQNGEVFTELSDEVKLKS